MGREAGHDGFDAGAVGGEGDRRGAGPRLGCLLVLRIVGARRMAAAEREFEAKAGPLPENLYASDRVPDEENAAILLRAGAEAVILLDKDKARAGDLTMTALRVWSHQDLAFLRDLLARNGPALELLRRTAGMTRSGFGLKDPADVDEELKTKLPLLKLLWAQRLLFLDAQVALREGAFARLADDVKAMSVLAVAVEREAPLISELVGIGAEKIVLETISDAVAHPELDAGTLSVLATTIPELDLRAAWRRSLACEFKLPQMSVASRPGPDAKRSLLKTALYLAAPGYFDAPYVEWMARIMQAPDAPYGSSLPALMEQHPRCSISPLDAITGLTQAAGRNQVVLSERRLARLAQMRHRGQPHAAGNGRRRGRHARARPHQIPKARQGPQNRRDPEEPPSGLSRVGDGPYGRNGPIRR